MDSQSSARTLVRFTIFTGFVHVINQLSFPVGPTRLQRTALNPETVHDGKSAQRNAYHAQHDAHQAVPSRCLPHVDESCRCE